MAQNNIVLVQPVVRGVAAQTGDISTLMILDTNHDSLDRYKIYASDEYQSTIASGTPLRKALDSAFSPTPTPSIVVVGRAKGTAVLSFPDVGDTDVFGVSIEVADGATVTASFTAGAADDAQDVATGLKADIDAVTAVTDHITATVVGTGSDAVLQITLVATTDDYRLYGTTSNVSVSYTTTEAAADSLSAIQDFYADFTFVMSTNHTPSYQTALAAACEVAKKLYFTSTALPIAYTASYDGVTAPDSSDILAVIAHANYQWSHAMYHEAAADYPEAQRVTRFSWLRPGTTDWQYKSLVGFGVAQHATENRALTTGEILNISSKYGSTIVNERGLAVVSSYDGLGNRVGSGDRIEHMHFAIYAKQQIEAILMTFKYNVDKLGMNDQDIGRIQGQIVAFADRETGPSLALNPANPYKIVFPKAKDITFLQQSSGRLSSVEATFYMNASIDSIHVTPLVITFTGL